MHEKIRLGIASCLLGNSVRYNGGHTLDRWLRDELGRYVEWVPVCPEVECGMPIPRDPMHLRGTPGAARLIVTKTGQDLTPQMNQWIARKLPELEKADLCGYVFKTKSPSSGMRDVKIYTEKGMPSRKGAGLFAKAFMERFPLLPVEDEGRLHDAGLRENFIERIFVMDRWRRYMERDGGYGGLVNFHTRHKLLLMAHGSKHLTALGRLASQGRNAPLDALHQQYLEELMAAMTLKATVKKHTNVLMHIMGYFKKYLTADEKQELVSVIEDYHQELTPLVAPLVLLQHYVRKFKEPYLEKQIYLNPHPSELKLRNHV